MSISLSVSPWRSNRLLRVGPSLKHTVLHHLLTSACVMQTSHQQPLEQPWTASVRSGECQRQQCSRRRTSWFLCQQQWSSSVIVRSWTAEELQLGRWIRCRCSCCRWWSWSDQQRRFPAATC